LLTYASSSSSTSCLGLLLLLSFPTRRSSDLTVLAQGRIVAVIATATYRDSRPHRAHSRALPALPRIGTATSPSACHSAEAARMGDRKSTRLNSSHVSSSYADFGLKK